MVTYIKAAFGEMVFTPRDIGARLYNIDIRINKLCKLKNIAGLNILHSIFRLAGYHPANSSSYRRKYLVVPDKYIR